MTITITPIYGKHNFSNILNAAKAKGVTQADFASLYADCIMALRTGKIAAFAAVNSALLKRYKPSSLERIKREAWKIVNAEREAKP